MNNSQESSVRDDDGKSHANAIATLASSFTFFAAAGFLFGKYCFTLTLVDPSLPQLEYTRLVAERFLLHYGIVDFVGTAVVSVVMFGALASTVLHFREYGREAKAPRPSIRGCVALGCFESLFFCLFLVWLAYR